MNEIQIFSNDQFGQIRVCEMDGKPWFIAADVCRILDISNPTDALGRLDEDERTLVSIEGSSNGLPVNAVSEAGLYVLVLGSRKKEARVFKRWVTHEVLPTIRKHGMWAREDILNNPDVLIAVATELKREQEARKALEAERATLLPKADYYDALVDRNGLTNLRNTAKLLEIPERVFITRLIEARFLYRDQKRRLIPYAAANKGYFAVKEYANPLTGHADVQTFVTLAGREHLLRVFGKLLA